MFGIWYGKGPGVDRCSDVFKHANMAGTAKHGGVIAIAGDDHIAKSSTAAHQSDHIFKACGTPVFFPVQRAGDPGPGPARLRDEPLLGRVGGHEDDTGDRRVSASISVDPDRVKIVLPEDFPMPPGGLHIRWPDAPLEQEARLMDHKWYAALAYVRANKLNHTVIDSPNARLGPDRQRQELQRHAPGAPRPGPRRSGLPAHRHPPAQGRRGLPLEATITREFATGLQEILVIEEKRQVIEYQLKEELYNWRPDVRPNVLGKFDEPEGDTSGGEWSRPNPSGNWLLRAQADLTPAIIARAIGKRLMKLGESVAWTPTRAPTSSRASR